MSTPEDTPRTSTLGLWLRTLLFVAILPAAVIGWGPYWITGWEMRAPLLGFEPVRWLGVALLLGGLPLFAEFLWRFVQEGHGTPAPIDPPKALVVRGAFQYVRNPGYVAVLALLVGQALLLGSGSMLVYAAVIWLVFHLFVVLHEEPDLRERFGDPYEVYFREVPRWIPRPRRPRQP